MLPGVVTVCQELPPLVVFTSFPPVKLVFFVRGNIYIIIINAADCPKPYRISINNTPTRSSISSFKNTIIITSKPNYVILRKAHIAHKTKLVC